MAKIPTELAEVTAVTKANIYFEGRVVSHTVIMGDKSKKTLGLIYPGKYHFGTEKAERMEIVSGGCMVKVDGDREGKTYQAGEMFEVPGKAGFDIEVGSGICEYICTFLD